MTRTYRTWADHWYKDAIIYSVDVEMFQDGNGDGTGDFAGLSYRLNYLASLGVSCVWLLPFYPSPNRDNGYDVTDYYNVDPRFGSLGDFVEFTHCAKRLGIQVIIDLVINHTSNQHPWFQAAREGPDSPFYDFYVWSKEEPPDRRKGMLFPGEQKEVWTYDDKAEAWYFHRFFAYQPDLNIASRGVRDELRRIMGFWLQLGVSGFRIDAAPFVVELRGIQNAPTDDPFVYLDDLSRFARLRGGDVVLMAEAAVPPDRQRTFFGSGDRLHMLSNFSVNQRMFLSLARGDARCVRDAIEALPKLPGTGQWAQFLRNHDEFNMEELSPDERADVFKAFGPEPRMQSFNRGIRRRLAPMLNRDERRIKLMHSLLLSLPGTPVLWYGDEIGMGDDLDLPGRESVRTPMQWSAEPNAGFSNAAQRELVRPVIEHGEYSRETVNVQASEHDSESLLNWIERALRIRKNHPSVGRGRIAFVETGDEAVLAHRAIAETETVLAVHNFSGDGRTVDLGLPDEEARELVAIFGDDTYQDTSGEPQRVQVSGHGYRWFRLPGEPSPEH